MLHYIIFISFRLLCVKWRLSFHSFFPPCRLEVLVRRKARKHSSPPGPVLGTNLTPIISCLYSKVMRSIHRGYNFRDAQTPGTITSQPKLLHNCQSDTCITFESTVYRIIGDGYRGIGLYARVHSMSASDLHFFDILWCAICGSFDWSHVE